MKGRLFTLIVLAVSLLVILSHFVLFHRVVLAPEAEMEEISEDMLIQQALKETLVKKE